MILLMFGFLSCVLVGAAIPAYFVYRKYTKPLVDRPRRAPAAHSSAQPAKPAPSAPIKLGQQR